MLLSPQDEDCDCRGGRGGRGGSCDKAHADAVRPGRHTLLQLHADRFVRIMKIKGAKSGYFEPMNSF